MAAGHGKPECPSAALGSTRWVSAWRTNAGSEIVICSLLAAVFALLYGATLCRTVYWYDSAELTAAAATLGIPHPPGYPLYTLVGKIFTLLPLEPALAVNLMSAVFGVLAVLACYAVSRELGATRGSAAAAAALLGLGRTFWRHATIAEAYTPGVAFLLAALWLAARGARLGSRRHVFGAGLVAGLGLGMHLSLATAGLCFVALCWIAGSVSNRGRAAPVSGGAARRWQASSRIEALAAGAGGAMLGACIFLYLPLRAQTAPEMNFGNPSTLEGLANMLSGGVYKQWFLGSNDASRALSVGWQIGRHVTVSGLPLAIAGMWALGKRRGALWSAGWGAGISGNLLYFWRYQVHDLEVFFLPAAALCCVAAALGLDLLLDTLRRARPSLDRRLVLGLVFAGLVVRGARLYPAQDLSEDRSALQYGQQLQQVLPEHAIIATYTAPSEWKYYTVFRWYIKLLRHQRPDVSVVTFPSVQLVQQLLEADHPTFAFVETDVLAGFDHQPVPGVDEGLLRLRPK